MQSVQLLTIFLHAHVNQGLQETPLYFAIPYQVYNLLKFVLEIAIALLLFSACYYKSMQPVTMWSKQSVQRN